MTSVTIVFEKTVEIPDYLVSLAGFESADDYVISLLDGAELPEILTGAEITVSVEGDDTDAEPVAPAPRPKPSQSRQDAASTPRVSQPTPARPTRQSAPVESPESEASGEPVRRGRPPRLISEDGSEWEASDGGPVTAWGTRSVQELKAQGIACRKVGATTWPKWYVRQMAESAESEETDMEETAPAPRRQIQTPQHTQTSGGHGLGRPAAASAPAPNIRRRSAQ